MQLFGSSGIRRIADKDLVQLVLKTGLAVGKVYHDVVVGSDTRTSSDALKHAFTSGLLASGAQSYDAGVIPTPTLALAAREFEAGVMITASHNPPEYNGIKLLNPDGSGFDSTQQQEIEDIISGESFIVVPWNGMKDSRFYNEAVENHIEHIMRYFPVESKLKVVLDCGCGAASVITPHLLRRLGCEVVALNCYPSGFFPHPVEPTEANLGDLIRVTRELGGIGIAHDGDADRMMAIDEEGRFIPGDKLLILLAQQLGAKEVVTTVDASMVIDEMDFKVSRTKVGDTFVSEALKKGGNFGGEPSGAWVFPKNSFCPDGIYAAVQLIAIASQQSLSQLVNKIPQYPLLRGSVSIDGIVMTDLEKRLLMLKPLSVSHVDGIKLNFEDGWLLVRASGTEPRIRITTEAKTETRVRQLYDSGVNTIKQCVGGEAK